MRLWLTLGTAAFLAPGLALAGPLDDVRSEVHSDSSSDSSDDSSSDWSSDDDDDDDFSDCFDCGGSGTLIARNPAYLPYPYALESSGYIDPSGAARLGAAQLQAESAYQYAGLWRVGMGGRASFAFIEADTEWSFYRDTRERDQLWIGDLNLGFTLLRVEHAIWHLGGGGRFLIDSQPDNPGKTGNAVGWNVTTGIDLFPFDPVTITTEANLGQLGQALYWRLRGSIGVQIKRAEVFAGYEHMQIGAAPLGGPMLGVRLWL